MAITMQTAVRGVSRHVSRAAATLQISASSCSSLLSIPVSSSPRSSFHTLSSLSFSRSPSCSFSSSSSSSPGLPTPANAKEAAAQQKAIQEWWRKFQDILLVDKFNLESFELLLQMQTTGASDNDSFWHRTRATVGNKLNELRGQSSGSKEFEPLLHILKQITPEEKKDIKKITVAAKARIAESAGVPVAEVSFLLDRFDQFASTSEWMRRRKEHALPMPRNMAQMQDFMREDKRSGSKLQPRKSAMDRRLMGSGRMVAKHR